MRQQIHDFLRKQKISDCFLVGIEFQNWSFVVKAIKCLSNFINQEYSAKPWNHCNHFEEFIDPKETTSLSLKDHRFNSDAVTLQKLGKVIQVQMFQKKETLKRPTMNSRYEVKTLFPEGGAQQI